MKNLYLGNFAGGFSRRLEEICIIIERTNFDNTKNFYFILRSFIFKEKLACADRSVSCTSITSVKNVHWTDLQLKKRIISVLR